MRPWCDGDGILWLPPVIPIAGMETGNGTSNGELDQATNTKLPGDVCMLRSVMAEFVVLGGMHTSY